MKKGATFLVAGLAALFLQTTVLPHLSIRPDLVLVLVVYLGISQSPFSGALLAFLLGCLMDVFAGSTLGFFALTKTLVFFCVYAMRGHLYFESSWAGLVLVSMGASIEAAILLILISVAPFSPTLPSPVGRLILYPILLTTLAAPFCFALLKRSRLLAL